MSEADEYGPGGDRESGPQSEDAIRDPLQARPEPDADGFVGCPECAARWKPSTGDPCPGCGLSWEDVLAGADFYDNLDPGIL